MAELKTKLNDQNVESFLDNISDNQKREDSYTLLQMMKQATHAEPKMWGSSIIGFGITHYKYESGREGDWFLIGFSPRKENLTLYIMGGFPQHAELLKALGKHKTGKSCLYIKRIKEIDLSILQQLIEQSLQHNAQNS